MGCCCPQSVATSDDHKTTPATPHSPRNGADKIGMKRLATLQTPAPLPDPPSFPSDSRPRSTPPVRSQSPKPIPKPSEKRRATTEPAVNKTLSPKPRKPAVVEPFSLEKWEPETIGRIFNITLDRSLAEASGWDVVWLKDLSNELLAQSPSQALPPLSVDIAHRCLTSRLEIDPRGTMTADPEIRIVVANLPQEQTTFEYLVSCWQRINSVRAVLRKRSTRDSKDASGISKANVILDQLRDLVISFAGLTLQKPTIFPTPETSKPLGTKELAIPLLDMSLATPFGSNHVPASLQPHETEPFIRDLAQRFEGDDLKSTFGECLVNEITAIIVEDKGGLSDTSLGIQSWRAGLCALDALTVVKPLAAMMPTMSTWVHRPLTGSTIERRSLIGSMARLGTFTREWPTVSEKYFSNPERLTAYEIDTAYATLRNKLHFMQQGLFNILNRIVRSGPEAREAVLNYFALAVQLNAGRGDFLVDPATVASDSFMLNLSEILLRFSEPFLDLKFSKLETVDPLYYARSSRLDIAQETRLLADAPTAKAFQDAHREGPPPNFVSDIFYLTNAYLHYGLIPTIHTYDNMCRRHDDLRRGLDKLEQIAKSQGVDVVLQAQIDEIVKLLRHEQGNRLQALCSYQCPLLDRDLVFRGIAFTAFTMTWLIRMASPGTKYPAEPVSLPLSEDVPEAFGMLPEYFIGNVLEFYLLLVRNEQSQIEAFVWKDLLVFILTFLSSPWYIKNPFLRAKLVQVISYGIMPFGLCSVPGVLMSIIHTHPLALQHLMPALMRFYVDVENAGASGQFYKFYARHSAAYIFREVWNDATHRRTLLQEVKVSERFVRFANLLLNDATYLLDEALSKLAGIKHLQTEMSSRAEWDVGHWIERAQLFVQAEDQATDYILLAQSAIELLKLFTAATKELWMQPEIVNRLAAMLDFNLDLLTGPRSAELDVKEHDKYYFKPSQLISDILSVFLNLSGEYAFIQAVAVDKRSYKFSLFQRAARIARARSLKTEAEIARLRVFVARVEEMKATMEVEEELGDVPDEFIDPISASIMRNPVILPGSKAVVDLKTIKEHLLSVPQDPFNRSQLAIENVVPAVELKARIDTFLAERKVSKAAALGEASDNTINVDE